MTIATVKLLLDVIVDNRLLQPDQLEELTGPLLDTLQSPRALAKYLVQRNWMTVYQVNQLFLGNGAELAVGPYRVLDLIGEGGVSRVFKAWDTRQRCVVALKVIREEHLANTEAVGRFQREMHAVAALSHPNIVRAFDADQNSNRHFFAMEYVEGVDLGKRVHQSGPLPVAAASDYVRQAALGLHHAHEHGLVHRDVKPSNLLLTVGGSVVKVLDLGLARLQGAQALTVEGAMIGTADYIAPEQARNPRTVDRRADVYGLGCTFYHLLAGRPPFPVRGLMDKLLQHQTAEPAPVAGQRPEVPAGLAKVVQKMMAKQPADRQQTAAEVAQVLTPYAFFSG
jgi:serine/threonine-protein kinase